MSTKEHMIIEEAFLFAQKFNHDKPIYKIRNDAIHLAGSVRSAYRYLKFLKSINLAKYDRGFFELNSSVVSQPFNVFQRLLPSLKALKNARRFGRSYNNADINFALENTPYKFITLDYKVWDLTKFQFPANLYLYVENIDDISNYLKDEGFYQGERGHIILLPRLGDFSNEIERTYLDCIANGGRSTLDAIALELLFSDRIICRGHFLMQDLRKVQQDMPLIKQETSNAYSSQRSH